MYIINTISIFHLKYSDCCQYCKTVTPLGVHLFYFMRRNTVGNLSVYMQLPLERQKALYLFFTYAVVLPKTCRHTLTSNYGGVTLLTVTGMSHAKIAKNFQFSTFTV